MLVVCQHGVGCGVYQITRSFVMIKKFIISKKLNQAADEYEANMDQNVADKTSYIRSVLGSTEGLAIIMQLVGSVMRLSRVVLLACITPGKEGDAIKKFLEDWYRDTVKRIRRASGVAEVLANNTKIKRAIETVEEDWEEYEAYRTSQKEKAEKQAERKERNAKCRENLTEFNRMIDIMVDDDDDEEEEKKKVKPEQTISSRLSEIKAKRDSLSSTLKSASLSSSTKYLDEGVDAMFSIVHSLYKLHIDYYVPVPKSLVRDGKKLCEQYLVGLDQDIEGFGELIEAKLKEIFISINQTIDGINV